MINIKYQWHSLIRKQDDKGNYFEALIDLELPTKNVDENFYVIFDGEYFIYRDRYNKLFKVSIVDGNQLKAIIDVSAQRGAFKPGEMAAVGTVYNKLSGFLEQVAKQGQQQNG